MSNEKEGIPEAGRELDALVAEKVMGWLRCSVNSWWGTPDPVTHNAPLLAQPRFSTDLAAAWQVVDRMREVHYVQVSLGSTTACEIWTKGGIVKGEGDTVPLAICRAALKAVAPPSGIPNPHSSNSSGAPKEGTGT